MQFSDIKELVKQDFQAVDELIQEATQSKVGLIHELGRYITQSGGKRIRPLVVLLLAAACGYKGRDHIALAAVIELVHTATLLHDDVVDESQLRRGRATANAVFGNEAAVLVGDFLYSKAFQILIKVGTKPILQVLAECTNIMAEGEALQLIEKHNPNVSEGEYLNIIRSKTAKLFEAAAIIAGLLSEVPESQVQALGQYGLHLGTAFQIIDDMLDYQASPSESGKNPGNDLSDGKMTLPLIYILQHEDASNHPDIQMVRDAIKKDGQEKLAEIQRLIASSGAIDYTLRFAKTESERAEKALSHIPDSIYKEAASALARFALERKS